MLSEDTFQKLVTYFALRCFGTGCLLFGGFYLLPDATWLGLAMMVVGCFVGKRALHQYNMTLEHSRAQNRAIQILTRQLTSDGEETTL